MAEEGASPSLNGPLPDGPLTPTKTNVSPVVNRHLAAPDSPGGGRGALGVASPVPAVDASKAKPIRKFVADPGSKKARSTVRLADKLWGSADPKYLDSMYTPDIKESADLTALEDPAAGLALVRADISSAEWENQYKATQALRQLLLFHNELVPRDDELGQVCSAVQEAGMNLRSALSRNALYCMADMYNTLPPEIMQPLTDAMVTVIIRQKGLKSQHSAFIKATAAVALKALVARLPNEATSRSVLRMATTHCVGVKALVGETNLAILMVCKKQVAEWDLQPQWNALRLLLTCTKDATARKCAAKCLRVLQHHRGDTAVRELVFGSGDFTDAVAEKFLKPPTKKGGAPRQSLRAQMAEQKRKAREAAAAGGVDTAAQGVLVVAAPAPPMPPAAPAAAAAVVAAPPLPPPSQ